MMNLTTPKMQSHSAQAQNYMQILCMGQPLFSYTLKVTDGITRHVVLHQEETGSTVHIAWSMGRINRFSLKANEDLLTFSEVLYDAALLELTMHALGYILFDVYTQNKPEYHCQLPLEDAGLVLELEDAFDHTIFSDVYYTPRRDHIVFEVARIEPHFFDTVFSDFTRQLKMGLWRMQKHDAYVRRFLQENALPNMANYDAYLPVHRQNI